jgi:hypothetical protein
MKRLFYLEPLEPRTLLDATLLIGTWNVDCRLGGGPNDAGALSRVLSIINTLHAALRREVVLIEIGHDPVDVAEIFSRLNSAGTRVNEGDIALICRFLL